MQTVIKQRDFGFVRAEQSPTRMPRTFAEWKAYANRVNEMAERIYRQRADRGWALARTVGIGRCGASLHNASISKVGEGWCAGPNGRHIQKTVRAAKRLIDDYSPYDIARRLSSRAWDHYIKCQGES